MRHLLFLLLAAALLSCQRNKTPDFKETQMAMIKGLEAETMKAEALDPALAKRITKAYLTYADSFPADSAAPYYISKAGDVLKARRETALKGINVYNRVIKQYPEHPLAARSVFMIGFTFDEVFGDETRASKSYSYFLEQYPEHTLADDARALLAMIQDTAISDLERVKQWAEEDKEKTKK